MGKNKVAPEEGAPADDKGDDKKVDDKKVKLTRAKSKRGGKNAKSAAHRELIDGRKKQVRRRVRRRVGRKALEETRGG